MKQDLSKLYKFIIFAIVLFGTGCQQNKTSSKIINSTGQVLTFEVAKKLLFENLINKKCDSIMRGHSLNKVISSFLDKIESKDDEEINSAIFIYEVRRGETISQNLTLAIDFLSKEDYKFLQSRSTGQEKNFIKEKVDFDSFLSKIRTMLKTVDRSKPSNIETSVLIINGKLDVECYRIP